ncbi:MAG: DNA helicase RecQ [Deltaproteobacteria bacterium]|nr:DNA helicase RecQ [Deltaproteobacteria bacterium]
MTEPGQNPAAILKQYWGHENFLPLQKEAIACVLQKEDSLLVLPTGGGKSACYQVPALTLDTLALVVSPLIALMKDQVDSLRLNGVAAACINSSMSLAEKRQVTEQLKAKELNLLYISPEKLGQQRSLDFLKTLNIGFIAVDEAHCISQWGHDFRPDYRQLGNLRKLFPQTSLHAYTATATAAVQQDIVAQLNLNQPRLLIGSFDRPNLTYRVLRKSARHFAQIVEVLERHHDAAGIIYCQSRREVEETAARLTALHRAVWPYHAGMADHERKANQEAFINHDAGIIVATIAFGMGIDKSNIRFVIHSGLPKALENYQQESGRAGRDGLPAECVLFHNSSDLQRWQRNLNDADHDGGHEGARRSLQAMSNYAQGIACRHRTLVNYFDQELEKDSCGHCDICLAELPKSADPLTTAQKIVSSILRQGENFGLLYSAQVLKGARDRRIISNQHDQLSTWGLLKEESNEQIKAWIDQLVSQGFLEREGEYQIIRVTPSGRELLRGEKKPCLLTIKTSATAADAVTAETILTPLEINLFDELRELRRELARDRAVPPYVIFSDASLYDMAQVRPTNLEMFRQVKGVGAMKLVDFGEVFTARISSFCRQHELDGNCRNNSAKIRISPAGREPKNASESEIKAFACFAEGLSIAETAQQLERALSTTRGYLSSYIRSHEICDPTPWVSPENQEKIKAAIAELGPAPLKPIFIRLAEKIAYDEIRIVCECWENGKNSLPQ